MKKQQGVLNDDLRAVAGLRRKRFFEAGGDPRRWSLLAGSHRMTDRRKEQSRKAARGRSINKEE